MRASVQASSNVIRFPGPRSVPRDGRAQRGLLDTVYTSGALVIAADDRETKSLASRLQVFGFLNIAEITPDGAARKLKPSEVSGLSTARPWRLSRPSFDELPPLAG